MLDLFLAIQLEERVLVLVYGALQPQDVNLNQFAWKKVSNQQGSNICHLCNEYKIFSYQASFRALPNRQRARVTSVILTYEKLL